MSSLKEKSSRREVTVSVESEEERLRKDIFRPDMEKFKLFTATLRVNAMYKRAKITHK